MTKNVLELLLLSQILYLLLFAEAGVSSSVHPPIHLSTRKGQTDRAGRDVWRGIAKIQRAVCGVLFISRSEVASGYVH